MSIFSLATWPNPITWLYRWRHEGKLTDQYAGGYPGTPPDYGQETTVDGALQIATVWACVRKIAQTVATLPLVLYESDGEDRRVARDHPLYGLLHDSPNGKFTSVEFWEGLVTGVCLWGNGYAEKKMMGSRLVALDLLRPDAVEVRPRNRNGDLTYRVHIDGQSYRDLREDQVFHVRGFGTGGDVGLSPVAYARHTLFSSRQMDRSSAQLSARGLRPQGVLKMEQVLKPDQRAQARKNILDPFLEGDTLILEAGMEWQPVTINPADAQMLESRAFNIEEICRWFDIPPILIGHAQQGQTMWGSGVEQIMLAWLMTGLRPYLERIEQSISRSLITAEERDRVFAEFKVEGLLRGDTKARAESYAKALGSGGHSPWMSVNEVRKLENMPPVDGGDEMTPPANLQRPAQEEE